MSDRLYIAFILTALLVIGLVSRGPLKQRFGHTNGLDFSVIENDHTLRLEVYYPGESTGSVEQYVKSRFGLYYPSGSVELALDPNNVMDSSMSFTARSREGFLELVMEKDSNSSPAQAIFRRALKDLEHNMGRLTSR